MTDPWCCYLFGNMDPINIPQMDVSIYYTSTMDPSWDVRLYYVWGAHVWWSIKTIPNLGDFGQSGKCLRVHDSQQAMVICIWDLGSSIGCQF